MPTASLSKQPRSLYNGLINMEPALLDSYFESIVTEFERRAYDNYADAEEDNLTFLEECTMDDPVDALKGTDRLYAKWRYEYWNKVRELTFRFYSLHDWETFGREFAGKFPFQICELYFEGPAESGKEGYDKHEECKIVEGKWRGCDICEVLYVLERRPVYIGEPSVSERLRAQTREGREGEWERCFPGGTAVAYKGSWDEERGCVVRLVVHGCLGAVCWGRPAPVEKNVWRVV